MKILKTIFITSMALFLFSSLWFVYQFQRQTWFSSPVRETEVRDVKIVEKKKEEKKQKEPVKKETKKLQEWFSMSTETVQFKGTWGYTLLENFVSKYEDTNVISYVYAGTVDDGRGETPGKGPRMYNRTYEMTTDTVTEIIENRDYRDPNDNRLRNLIPNQIILKSPIEQGSSWNQTFEYQSKNYTAVSTIVSLNRVQMVVETKVTDIGGFPNQTYIEKRVYEKGKGLISFENTAEGNPSFSYKRQ